MIDTAQFLYQQSPVFWCALAGVFFLLGLLYASVAWQSYKHALRSAQREKSQLLRERNQAVADRQRRRRLRERGLANGVSPPQKASGSAQHKKLSTSNDSSNETTITSNGAMAANGSPNGGGVNGGVPTESATNDSPLSHHDKTRVDLAVPAQMPAANGYPISNGVKETSTNGEAKPDKLAALFSSNYQSGGSKKNGKKPH